VKGTTPVAIREYKNGTINSSAKKGLNIVQKGSFVRFPGLQGEGVDKGPGSKSHYIPLHGGGRDQEKGEE